MSKYIFIACSKKKSQKPCKAKDMYLGDLFKKSYQYGKSLGGEIYILSAKYGLLNPEDYIDPYNITLNNMTDRERKRWAYKVIKQCEKQGIYFNDKIIFLCGSNYRKYLQIKYRNSICPLKGMGIGEQLAFLNEEIKKVRKPQ